MYGYALSNDYSLKDANIDERKNLLYVAITRAKSSGIFLYEAHVKGIGNQAFRTEIQRINSASTGFKTIESGVPDLGGAIVDIKVVNKK